MPVYSNSKLSTYENCPQQYKLRYIDKVELPEEAEEGIETFLGSRRNQFAGSDTIIDSYPFML